MLNVGEQAPGFTVQDQAGREVSLSDFQGRHVVLWFYPKADTPGCTAEGCRFRDLAAAFAEQGAAILGVSFDPPAENAAFAEKFGFNFPLLCDVDRQVGLAYGACDSADAGYAQRIGVIIGPEGKVLEARPADARTYPDEALAFLQGQ